MEYKNHNVDLYSRKCELCGGKLRIIGLQRKNGKNIFGDWQARKLHKKCWYQNYKKIV